MKRALLLIVSLLGLTLAQQRTITISGFPNLTEAIEVIIERYMAENPDVNVVLEVREFGDHHTNLLTTLAAGTGATDVVAIEIGYIARFVAEGGLVDLSQPPYNASEFLDQLADYAVAQATTVDGRIVAIPTDIAPGVMFYRRDRFEEIGADIEQVIRSWDDYIAFGQQVTRDTNGDGQIDVFLIADAADVFNAMIRIGLEPGQGLYFDANGNPLVNTERFHEAFRVAKAIRDAGLDAQIGAWSNEWYEAFRRGTVATQFSGAWLQGHLQSWMAPETAGLWGVSRFPGDAFAPWGGSFYAIPEQSANKELAWDLIKFMTTREDIQKLAFNQIEAFPAVKALWDDPVFEEPQAFLAGQQSRLLYIDIVDNIQGTFTHPGDIIAEEVVGNALSSVLNEGRDIAEALAEAEAIIRRRVR